NPGVGRERTWGDGTLERGGTPKRVLVAGAGPAGLEYARVAAARGHEVVVYEREEEVGGHVRAFSRLPGRAPFAGIADWLVKQAQGNGPRSARPARRPPTTRAASITWSSRPARATRATASR